jgi:tRNA(Ile)-lysidine synthase
MLTRIVQIAEEGITGKRLRIAANLQAYVDRSNLIFEYDKNPHWQALQIVPGMEYKTDYFRFASEIVKDRDYSEGIEQRTIEYLDLDKLGENLVLRPWEKSDRIKPLNAPYTKKVSDIFIDQKIPLNKKKRIPILESDGKIVWVCGLKLSDEFKLKPMTRRTLKVYYEELL